MDDIIKDFGFTTGSPKIIKVIGKSTYTVIYASRIPTFFEFNTVGFYFLFAKQVIYVYCKCHKMFFNWVLCSLCLLPYLQS